MKDKNYYLHCDAVYKGDKPFKRAARTKQSTFREETLKVPFDPENRYGRYGAFLLSEDAERGLNFCEEFRAEILKRIKERYPSLSSEQHDGLYANLLRSEHIPWNIFVPMDADRVAAAKVFDNIIGPNVVDEVTDIRIEWAPEKSRNLNDNTSFDVFIEYMSKGEKCGIGIEVKYTEQGYPWGKKEYREVMENDHSRYAEVTRSCGFFKDEINSKPLRETDLCMDDFRQIWRNHILGASMLSKPNPQITRFHSITLFPSGNPHFLVVLPQYQEFLTVYGASTFGYITFEDLFKLLRAYYHGASFDKWIDYLENRYPF